MAKKLKLNPMVSYFLGVYAYNKGTAIGVVAWREEVAAKFVKIAIDEFEVDPTRIMIDQKENEQQAYFYNSKLKKLLDKALDTRERLFKYKNAYSGSYFAGIFDMKGGRDAKGMYVRDMTERDSSILEQFNIHTLTRGSKTYILNEKQFLTFIKEFSATID